MRRCLPVVVIFFLCLMIPGGIIFRYYSNETQLKEYEPRGQAENEVTAILIQYQDAKNRFDLDRFLACLHETGEYSFKGVSLVSKATLKEYFPGFWATLQSSDRIVLYPLSHEFVTGDYFLSGRFINPQISISEDTARVMMTFASGWWRQKIFISMLRCDHGWLINRLEWEEA